MSKPKRNLTKNEWRTLRVACRLAIDYEQEWLAAVGYQHKYEFRRPKDKSTLDAIRKTLTFIRRCKALIKKSAEMEGT